VSVARTKPGGPHILDDPNPRLTDDEVRDLGYSHRDGTGRWVHRRELEISRRREDRRDRSRRRGEARCLTCGVTDDRHFEWCWRGDELESTVGAAARDARDLEAAIRWEPKVDVPKISAAERVALNKLFAARVARKREEAREQTPRKLWTLREWRDRGTA
jgi:hypothetical protein